MTYTSIPVVKNKKLFEVQGCLGSGFSALDIIDLFAVPKHAIEPGEITKTD